MLTELVALEQKIDQLVSMHHALRQEKNELALQLGQCKDENTALKEKIEISCTRLSAIVERIPGE